MTNRHEVEEKEKHTPREEPMSFMAKIAVIGLFGGVFWSLVGYFAFFLNFARVGPALILMPWAVGDWKNGYLGQWVGILLIGILSIGVAYLYAFILRRIDSMWPGLFFGAALWLLVFYVFNPLFPGLKSLNNLDINTIFTTLALYLLYGVFIGYSISYEYAEMQQ